MKIKFKNNSSSKIYVSMLMNSLEPGETSVAITRAQSEIDCECQLNELLASGSISLVFEAEETDSTNNGYGKRPPEFSNETRPGAEEVPLYGAIWNTDDIALNWTDGSDWRDANGDLT